MKITGGEWQFARSGQSFFMIMEGDPVHVKDGNVMFPDDWMTEDAARWRRENNVPGDEWQPQSGGAGQGS